MVKKTLPMMILAVCVSSASAGGIEKRAAALLKAVPDKEFTVMVIPTAGNFISNKIVEAVEKPSGPLELRCLGSDRTDITP